MRDESEIYVTGMPKAELMRSYGNTGNKSREDAI